MQLLTQIPFTIETAALRKRLHLRAGSPDEADLDRLVELALRIGRPRALYRECEIDERLETGVRIVGVEFTSPTLKLNLAGAERVFAYVATCGRELYEARAGEGDILHDFWWDAIQEVVLGAASSHLVEHLKERHRLGHTAAMNPGSGDVDIWPIEQQEPLFGLLGDVRGAIGVELTPSMLMLPNKSVSGILFPTESDFRSCQVCRREHCPGRSAPFDEALWREVQP